MAENKYSFWIGVKKVLKYLVIVGVPFIVAQVLANNPDFQTLTIGDLINQLVTKYTGGAVTVAGVIIFVQNFIKNWGGKIRVE